MLRILGNHGVGRHPRGGISAVVTLCLVVLTVTPVAVFAQVRAQWVTPARLTARNGVATLRWSVEGGEGVVLFRIREEFSGERQISYTDQAEIRVVRNEPGDYSFWVQACRRYADGYPLCGDLSSRLTLSVPGPCAGSTQAPGQGNGFLADGSGNKPEPAARISDCGRRVCK